MNEPQARSGRNGVLVLGPVYCDLVFADLDTLPQLGEERFARRLLLAAGGSAITAIALRRLGHRVSLASQVGDDAHGRLVRASLMQEGVDTRLLEELAGTPTPVTVVLSTPADRAFVTYLGTNTTAPDLSHVLARAEVRHMHVAGFPVALAHPDVVESGHRHGLSVSFDPGWDARALTDPRVRAVARDADVLLPNRLEACLLLGAPATTSASEALTRLAATRPHGLTVVKDGPDGAHAHAGEERAYVAAPPVQAIDPTGAGDVFDAGFLDAWLSDLPLTACLEHAVRCGAAATTAYGGASAAPRRSDLEASA